MADPNDPKNVAPGPDWRPAFPGSTDWVPPSDKEVPYTVKENPLTPKGSGIGLPGHKQTYDAAKVRQQAYAHHMASEAYNQARSDAQRRKDTAGPQAQHSSVPAKYTPAPKRGKR